MKIQNISKNHYKVPTSVKPKEDGALKGLKHITIPAGVMVDVDNEVGKGLLKNYPHAFVSQDIGNAINEVAERTAPKKQPSQAVGEK